ARAQSFAKDAILEYRELLSVAFSLTQVLASLVQHDPKYSAVHSIFNSTAPALISAAPLSHISSLQLAPAGVVRDVYPWGGNEKLLGFDLMRDPQIAPSVLFAISNRNISLEGPVQSPFFGGGDGSDSSTSNGSSIQNDGGSASGSGGEHIPNVLIVRKAIHVPVTDRGDTFQRPDEPNSVCGSRCEYDNITGTKFWGLAAVIVRLDLLQVSMGGAMVPLPLRTLAAMGYRYKLLAPEWNYNRDGDGGGDGEGVRSQVVVESSKPLRSQSVHSDVELGPGAQ
ncbi:hypothetical protein Vretifemale_10954, partial [Volvox reticuliferus]